MIRTFTSLFIVLLTSSVVVAQPASPNEPQCLPLAGALNILETTYKETPVFVGAVDKDLKVFLIITANPDTKAWTQLMVNTVSDVACLMRDGISYTITPLQKSKPPTTDG